MRLRTLARILVLGCFVPAGVSAQTADSLHLLWRNEAISGVTAHAFSHSGTILALANDREIRLWDMMAGKFVRTIAAPSYFYDGIAFTPGDSALVLVTSKVPWHAEGVYPMRRQVIDRSILTCDLADGSWKTLTPFQRPTDAWALSPNGEEVAVLTDFGLISLYDTRTLNLIARTTLEKDTVFHPYGPTIGIYFAPDKIVVFWKDRYRFLDPDSLQAIGGIEGSFPGYSPSPPIGNRIFINYGNRPDVYRAQDGRPSSLQPPAFATPGSPAFLSGSTNGVLLAHGNVLVSRYEAETWTFPIDYGNRTGIDTLIISSKEHPNGEWGVQISPVTKILGVLPNDSGLLLGNANSFSVLSLHSHRILPIIPHVTQMIGFFANGLLAARDGPTLLAIDPRNDSIVWMKASIPDGPMVLDPDGRSFALTTWRDIRYYFDDSRQIDVNTNTSSYPQLLALFRKKVLLRNERDLPRLYLRSNIVDGIEEPLLDRFSSFLAIGNDSVIAFQRYGRCDSALLYSLDQKANLRAFAGGLNSRILHCAASVDHNWLVTAAPFRNGRLWNLRTGALAMTFPFVGPSDPNSMSFTSNGSRLLYSNDSFVNAYDFSAGKSSLLLASQYAQIQLSRNGAELAVLNGRGEAAMYEVPAAWQGKMELNPKTVYLPLRFYIPKDAKEALDTNGRAFNPPRAYVVLELKYGDGRLIKRIIDGPLHKGKWHEWVYDMTGYSKGTYIMHTEIGGEVKDEKMELK